MSGRNIEDFFSEPEAFDALTDEDKARLLAGESLEGETKTAEAVEDNSETPAAVTVVDPEKSETPVDPVVLAKDGKHTIPFSELEAARERARVLEQQVIDLQDSQAKPQAEVPATAVQAPPIETEIADLRRQYREAMYSFDSDLAESLEAKIDAAMDRRYDAKMEARESQKQAKDEQDSAVTEAHTRAAALVEQYPFLNPQGSVTNKDAIDLVVAQRDRLMGQGMSFADAIEKAVAKVAPLFDKGNTTQQTDSDVARKAAEVISKAKAPVATSLSQAPASTKAQHDEGEAIRSMDINQLSRSLESKSPDEIMKLMNRVL